MSCPSGQIRRRASAAFKSSCITDRGKKGKGKQLFVLKQGKLGQYGYFAAAPATERHAALDKSVKAEGYATTVRRINAIRVLNKNAEPRLYALYSADLKYLQQKHTQKGGARRTSSSRGSPRRRSRRGSSARSPARTPTRSSRRDSRKYSPIPSSNCSKNKMKKVMGEFKRGTLRSPGLVVTNRKQAIAIGLSQARKYC